MKVHYMLWVSLAAFLATGLVHAQCGATVKDGSPAATSYMRKSANFGPKQGGNKRLSKETRSAKAKSHSNDERKSGTPRNQPANKASRVRKAANVAKTSQARREARGPKNGHGGKRSGSKTRGGN